jgi:hypothetical protein
VHCEEEIALTIRPTALYAWQRPTLPRLETKYHRRWGVSRPSSEWDRVQPPRHSHQADEAVRDNFLVSYTCRSTRSFGLFLRRSNATPAGPKPKGHDSGRAQAAPLLNCSGAESAQQPLETIKDQHCLMRAFKPIELLVPVSYTCHHASTPGLSTWWSSTALREYWFRGGFPA